MNHYKNLFYTKSTSVTMSFLLAHVYVCVVIKQEKKLN